MKDNKFTLKEVLEFSQSSDLKNLSLKNDYKDMVNLINMTLIDIHSRLLINQKILEVPLEHNKTIYNLIEYIKE